MTVGKPDFNLNSFGVKYLSKDEVQEFLNKKDKVDDSTGKYGGNSTVKPNADISPPYTPNLANPKMEQNPKGRGEHVPNVTNNEAPKIKPDANTKYVFNEPTYGIPDTRKRQTSGEGETGAIGTGTANDTRKLTGSAVGNVGNAPEGVKNTVQSKQGKRNVKVGVGAQAKEVFDATSGKGEKFYAKDRKEDNSIEGENRQNKKDEVTRGKKLKLTKLEQAKIALDEAEAREKKIKKPYVEGDKNTPEDIPTKGTDVEDNVSTQGEPNKPKFVPERPKTGTYDNIADNKETAKRKKESAAAAAAAKLAKEKPIDWKKTHGARRQRVEEHRSERGLKNASNIIMDMAIMKLDLMKDAQDGKGAGKPWNDNLDYGSPQTSATERSETNVSNYIDDYKGEEEPDGTTFEKLDEVGSHDDDEWHKSTTPKDRAAWVKNMTGKQPLKGAKFTPKIAKNSAETVFKTISLKLDLMNKKDEWDKNERNNENRSRRGRGSPDKSKLPFGTKQEMLHSQAVSGSGKGLKTRENLNPKPIDPKKQTFGEDSEEYGKIYDMQNETLKSQADETIFKAISLKLDLMKDVKSKRHNYTKLTSAGKNPAKKSPNASEALGAAYASGKMTENSVDADTNTETGATGKPKGSVADQYT